SFLAGRRTAWITLLGCLVALGLTFALIPQSLNTAAPQSRLAASADSQHVADLLAHFPTAPTTPGIVEWNRTDGQTLSTADRAAIVDRVTAVASLSSQPQDARPQVSVDRTVMLVQVTVSASSVSKDASAVATRLRSTARSGLPSDLEARVTGDIATAADDASAYAGTTLRLLLVLALVVAVLLILLTRSLLVWIVPLVVIAAADWLTRIVAGAVSAALGMPITADVSDIVSVVVAVVGAGFSLILIARYREELRPADDRHLAMRKALSGAGAVITASAATITLGMLALTFASLGQTQAIGLAGAIGVVIAAVLVLVMLPAALVVVPRGLFWLPVPRLFDPKVPVEDSPPRFASTVDHRRIPVAIIAAVIIGVLTLGLVGAQLGGHQSVGHPESVQAQKVVDHAFGPGYGNQAIMLVPDSLRGQTSTFSPTTLAIDQDVVHSVLRGESHDGRTELVVALNADARSPQAIATIRSLRASIARTGGPTAETLIGGPDAVAIDTRDAAATDRITIIPILIGVLLLMLILLTRALVAPVILIAASTGAFFGGLGLANLISVRLLGYPTLDSAVIVPAFAVVVAIGVGYGVVLMLRATGRMRDAISSVGGVLAGSGIVVAGGFVVLAVTMPVVALIQLGWIVAIGALLEAIIVRAFLVPALAFILGGTFYWPRRKIVTASLKA
ncbi:MAG TPA: MMPL family transporter, partial [Galbitalea sp.]